MIDSYDLGQFVDVKSNWLKTGQCTWFVHGNLTHEAASSLCMEGNSLLNVVRVSLAELSESGVVSLPKGSQTVYTVGHENSSFDANLSYYQSGPSQGNLKADVLNTLVHTYLASPFVSDLKNTQGMTKVAMREAN